MRCSTQEERDRVKSVVGLVVVELRGVAAAVVAQARSKNDFQRPVGSQNFASRHQLKLPPCAELTGPTGDRVPCQPCGGRVQVKVYGCKLYGTTLPTVKQEGTRSCIGCISYH